MLNVQQVAFLLGKCEETVRRHAQEWHGIKLGRDWAFPDDIEARLLESNRRALKENPCSTSAVMSGTSGSLGQARSQYAALLGPKTKRRHRNSTTSSLTTPGGRTSSENDPGSSGSKPLSDTCN